MAAAQVLYLTANFDETVDLSMPPKPRQSRVVNPLAALRLFQGGRGLRLLSLVRQLQACFWTILHGICSHALPPTYPPCAVLLFGCPRFNTCEFRRMGAW